MSDEYKPLIDPIINLSTSCSKDDALKYLLGWLTGPIQPNYYPEDASPEEMEWCDFSVCTSLHDDRERAEANYSNAKAEKLDQDSVNIALKELQRCDELFARAHRYLCDIDDELAKGELSVLRIDRPKTTNPQYPYITLASLADWAKGKYEIDIFEKNQNAIRIGKNQSEMAKSKTTPKSIDSLQVTFSFLLEAFVSKDKKDERKFGTQNNMNISQIAQHLSQMAEACHGEGKGQSTESIKKRIEEALGKKESWLNSTLSDYQSSPGRQLMI